MNDRQVAIFGLYKTGTTALFYQLLEALPPDTHALFEPTRYETNRGCGSAVLAKVILGLYEGPNKVHYEDFLGFRHKILLLRDPRDRIVSGTLFIVQQSPQIYEDERKLSRVLALLRGKEKEPTSIPLVEILSEILRLAGGVSLPEAVEELKTHHQWVFDFESRLGRHLSLKYEDFVDRRLAPLQNYLGLGLGHDVKVDPEHDHVARTHKYGDWKNWFLEEDVEYFKPATEEYLVHFGYPTAVDVSEHPEIPSAHASDYVLRTVEKRRKNI